MTIRTHLLPARRRDDGRGCAGLFVAGALIIPYIAVVFANGGREPIEDAPDTLRLGTDRELPSGAERRAS